MPSPEVALALAYLRRYNRIRVATGLAVARAWDRLGGIDDTAQAIFADRAALTVDAGRSATAATTDAYLAAILTVESGEPHRSIGVRPDYPRPVDPLEVYRRGAITARTVLSNDGTLLEALAAARARMVATAHTDIALTQRAATVDILAGDDSIVGYRRVLTGASCALCASASTQRYHSSQLMPIHANCDCGIAPIVGDRDPGHIINRPLYDDLKTAGRRQGDPEYWRSRKITVDEDGTVHLPQVAVRDHGELGPVLTDASDDFTSAADLAA